MHTHAYLRPSGPFYTPPVRVTSVAGTLLPAGSRYFGAGWGQAKEVIAANEQGDNGTRLVVRPGGALDIASNSDVNSDGTSATILPGDRMSASGTNLAQDLRSLEQLDPANEENWTVVAPPWLNDKAWTFEMKPPHHSGVFKFLTFRDPTRSSQWQLSPVYPVKDDSYGHEPHMVSTQIGGVKVPVICGPGGRTHQTLSAVRGAAAKWTHYPSAEVGGLDPGFSV